MDSNRQIKYFLENTATNEWYCMATGPFVHSYLYGTLESGEPTWTNDLNHATNFFTKEDAQQFRDKFYNYPNFQITEHEFVSLPSPIK